MSSGVHTLLPASCLGAPTEITSPQPPSNNFTSLPPPSHQMVSLSALPTSSSLSMAQSSPSLSTMPPSAGSLLTNQPSSLSALPPSSLSLPPPHFQPVLEPSLHYHPVQVETVQAGGDMKERRSSLTLGTQQQPASNPQHQLQNQQHFNMLQQPNIVQQLSALQQQQQQHPLPSGAATSAIDYTPLKVHESLASRAASPISAAGRADEGHFDLARLLQYQDQGWRLPQYLPMLRKEDQPVARREGLPWTGPAPQIGQDRWLPPSAHHQVGSNWTGWQERTPLH